MNNLFENLPDHLEEELTEIIIQSSSVRIERIVSTGQASPEDFWYDQEETEWVVLLKGEAELLFEENEDRVTLKPGDHVLIQPHQKHRVAWTSSNEPTIWLAVFYS